VLPEIDRDPTAIFWGQAISLSDRPTANSSSAAITSRDCHILFRRKPSTR